MDAPVETGETPIRDASPSFRCLLCNTEVVHKIAHVLLQGLATSCVDNTTGDLFKEPRSVAVDIRKEMVEYLTERSESIIAESFLLHHEGGGSNDVIEVSDHPTEVITDIVDDFAGLKRNFMGKVSGWLLSENREDRIDDFIQEMEKTGFWMIDRRKAIAELLLINVDYKNAYHCDLQFESESEVDEHRMKCEFRPIRCTNVGCNATFCAMQKDEHDSICSLKILNCEQNCEQMIISSRRKFDILGIMVSIIGSKDQLINEYRVMLAEKLLNKSDYDIDSEIRTVELLKIHFGESSMQNCEIMLNDLIDSRRTNTNIKASLCEPSQPENGNVSLDVLDATIMSMNFWPPLQVESINMPAAMDAVLTDYAKRFHEIKRPRKLLWLKNHGTVKLELQFEGRALQFSVAPIHAVIIMKFQEQKSWCSKDIADSIGIPVDILNKRMTFWINKGIIAESHAAGTESNNHVFTIIEGTDDIDINDISHGDCEDLLANEDEHGNTVASVEDSLKKEMGVYEKFIMGMLTNFGTMTLDKIHNTLKIFCVAEPAYDKTLQQLQTFLSLLVSEEKLDLKGNLYLKK